MSRKQITVEYIQTERKRNFSQKLFKVFFLSMNAEFLDMSILYIWRAASNI